MGSRGRKKSSYKSHSPLPTSLHTHFFSLDNLLSFWLRVLEKITPYIHTQDIKKRRFIMELHLRSILALFSLVGVVVVGHAAGLPSEIYWKKVFPSTPIPQAVKESLRPAARQKEGNNVRPQIPPRLGPTAFLWTFAATVSELHDDAVRSMFFLEKDLHIGSKMTLHFPYNARNTFLPRHAVESIPFSTRELPQNMNRFSVKPESLEARLMKDTLEKCEARDVDGSEHLCATSLESMVDYVASKLGKKGVKALSPVIPKDSGEMQYTVSRVTVLGNDHSPVACHNSNYPYTVFLCHLHASTVPYAVSLLGTDGTRVTALATCHTETSQFNPKNIGFQVLKVNPGATVCHFFGEHDVLWVRK